MGCERFRIHASPFEVVSLMFSQSATTQFALTFSSSPTAASASESTRHLWKVFRLFFFFHHTPTFDFPFLTQHGARPISNPRVTFRSGFVDIFPVGNDSIF